MSLETDFRISHNLQKISINASSWQKNKLMKDVLSPGDRLSEMSNFCSYKRGGLKSPALNGNSKSAPLLSIHVIRGIHTMPAL